jgi:hypothetical protein
LIVLGENIYNILSDGGYIDFAIVLIGASIIIVDSVSNKSNNFSFVMGDLDRVVIIYNNKL